MARSAFNTKTQPIVDGILSVFHDDKPPLTVRMIYYRLSASPVFRQRLRPDLPRNPANAAVGHRALVLVCRSNATGGP